MTVALHADELVIVEHNDTEHRHTDVHYTLGTAGLTTCTIIDPATGETIEQYDDILTTHVRKIRHPDATH